MIDLQDMRYFKTSTPVNMRTSRGCCCGLDGELLLLHRGVTTTIAATGIGPTGVTARSLRFRPIIVIVGALVERARFVVDAAAFALFLASVLVVLNIISPSNATLPCAQLQAQMLRRWRAAKQRNGRQERRVHLHGRDDR